MNTIFQKVLSVAEAFANDSNRLSLAADSLLDRIVPKSTAYAACWQYRTVRSPGCYCVIMYQIMGRFYTYQRRYCEGSGCGTLCNPWESYGGTCKDEC